MSEEKKDTLKKGVDEVEVAASKLELWVSKHQKKILSVVGGIVIVVALFLAVKQYYIIPREKQAQVALFKGEFYFLHDSIDYALNGDEKDFIGFEGVISEYRFTPAANIAKAYAGLCYKKKGDYEKAISYLKDFSACDPLVSPAVMGAIGDCLVELGEVEKSVSYFEKAAKKADNDLISPMLLKKAAIACESLKDYKRALKNYSLIKEKYYTSQDAADIDKYIERVKSVEK